MKSFSSCGFRLIVGRCLSQFLFLRAPPTHTHLHLHRDAAGWTGDPRCMPIADEVLIMFSLCHRNSCCRHLPHNSIMARQLSSDVVPQPEELPPVRRIREAALGCNLIKWSASRRGCWAEAEDETKLSLLQKCRWSAAIIDSGCCGWLAAPTLRRRNGLGNRNRHGSPLSPSPRAAFAFDAVQERERRREKSVQISSRLSPTTPT